MLIGYSRTSTMEQNHQLQLDALMSVGCERIFQETASGAQRDRPELVAAIDFARSDDTIVVWKMDRMARSLKQLIETVEKLDSKGVGFKSLTESIDTTSPGGKLIFHIFGALAEFERSMIRERTIAGLRSARAQGRVGGRPPAMSEDDILAAKAMLTDPLITVKQVAQRLGVSVSTLYKHVPAIRSS